MRLAEKFKQDFKWHLLTAFLTLIVVVIFNDESWQIGPTIFALLVGSFLLGLLFFIGDCLMVCLVKGGFKGSKRIKDFLLDRRYKN